MPGAVVVTASAGSFPGLVEALQRLPVPVEEHPLLTFSPPLDWKPVDDAVGRLESYDALAFTSPRAAAAFRERLNGRRELNRQAGEVPPVWAAGSGTAAALEGFLEPVRTPSQRSVGELGAAAALARVMLATGVRRVLFPCGDIRRDELPARLRDEGVEVDELVCYRSVLAGETAARHAAGRAGVLIVASPSVADLLARACPAGVRPQLVAVGPTTASAALASGWRPDAVATRPTVDALVACVRTLTR